MKKILFVIRSLEFGGAEKSLVNLLRELPKEKYQIDLLLFKKKGGFLPQVPEWVNILETPEALGKLFSPLKNAGRYALTKLVGTLRAKGKGKTRKQRMAWRWQHYYKKTIAPLPGKYDAAVAYVGTEVLYYVSDHVDAAKKYVWIHNDYRTALYSKNDDAPYFAKIDGIVSVSQDCVNVMKEEFPEHAHKICYIENITSSQVIRRLAGEQKPTEYTDGCNILSVGRLSKQKGFDLAIRAAAILREKGVDFHWHIIGDGDQKDALQEDIRKYQVGDCVHLLGTRQNPYPYMKHCTFLAQPSRFEGKSVVLDEAKILCTPILATAYPTVADQIAHGKEGIVTELTPEGIAEGVLTMLRQDGLRDEIRQYLAAQEFGNQTEVEKYIKLLDD